MLTAATKKCKSYTPSKREMTFLVLSPPSDTRLTVWETKREGCRRGKGEELQVHLRVLLGGKTFQLFKVNLNMTEEKKKKKTSHTFVDLMLCN